MGALDGRRILITGIRDASSLACFVARAVREAGGEVVCAGLGPTPHHAELSGRAERYVAEAWEAFRKTVETELGADVPALAFDVTREATLHDLAGELAARELPVDGLLHAVAQDRTLRQGTAQPLIEVSREDFLGCLDVSAYSLVAMLRALRDASLLRRGASAVALSYVGAERVVRHPYKNVAVAKAALERIVVELAAELGPALGVRVNAVRFAPWAESKAGSAIAGLAEAAERWDAEAPLGSPGPEDLADEVVHLLRPRLAVTGEVRNVDGGRHRLI